MEFEEAMSSSKDTRNVDLRKPVGANIKFASGSNSVFYQTRRLICRINFSVTSLGTKKILGGS